MPYINDFFSMRGIIVAVIIWICLALQIAAMASFMVRSYDGENRDLGLWRSCSYGHVGTASNQAPGHEKICESTQTHFLEGYDANGDSIEGEDCSSLKHTIRAARAFHILALIFTVVAFILAILYALRRLRFFFVAICLIIVVVFTLIAWIIGIAVFTYGWCETKGYSADDMVQRPGFYGSTAANGWYNNYNWGPCTPLMIGAFILALAALIATLICGDEKKKVREPVVVKRVVQPAPAPVRAPTPVEVVENHENY